MIFLFMKKMKVTIFNKNLLRMCNRLQTNWTYPSFSLIWINFESNILRTQFWIFYKLFYDNEQWS